MKRILRSRLPERFADRVPPALVEMTVAMTFAAVLTVARVALLPFTGDRAPYAFVFVAVVCSAVLAGWRSGLLALALGQLLAWTLIIMPGTVPADRFQYTGGLAIASLAQLVTLAVIALYQREIARASAEQESRIELLDRARREIDHRTANNYQTMLALVQAQAKGASDPAARRALYKVSDRLRAIGDANARIARTGESLESIRLAEHLQQLCAQIEQGLFRSDVALECEFADVSVEVERATAISILVNELATNALKHAFPDGRPGVVRILLRRIPEGLELIVADDGVGTTGSARTRGSGIGSRLIDAFVKQLAARHTVESGDGGTRHRVRIPIQD